MFRLPFSVYGVVLALKKLVNLSKKTRYVKHKVIYLAYSKVLNRINGVPQFILPVNSTKRIAQLIVPNWTNRQSLAPPPLIVETGVLVEHKLQTYREHGQSIVVWSSAVETPHFGRARSKHTSSTIETHFEHVQNIP